MNEKIQPRLDKLAMFTRFVLPIDIFNQMTGLLYMVSELKGSIYNRVVGWHEDHMKEMEQLEDLYSQYDIEFVWS